MVAPIIAAAGKVAVRMLAAKAAGGDKKPFLSTPLGKTAVAAGVTVVVLPPLALVGLVVMVTQTTTSAAVTAAQADQVATYCLDGDSGPSSPVGVTYDALSANQLANASTIIGVALSAVPAPGGATVDHTAQQRAAVIAVATALQESTLTNLPGGDRDSVGLFQQRPSMSWGSVDQLVTPSYAAAAFLLGAGTNHGLLDIPNWSTIPLTTAAQAVQRSAYPDAYAKWEALATSIVANLWAAATPIPVPGDLVHPTLTDTGVQIVAGDVQCATGSDYTAATGTAPGAWGGYSNGQIPAGALCVIPWAPTYFLRCDAVTALSALNEAYKADHGGANLGLTAAYRDYATQVSLKASEGSLAATPGTSNHGWALAVDLANFGGVGQYDAPNYIWMKAHAADYGFVHPTYMEPGGSGPLEPWHWEYWGSPATSTPTPQ